MYKVGYARARARRLGIDYKAEGLVVPRGFEVDIWPVGWEVEVRKGGGEEVAVVDGGGQNGKANGN